MPFLATQWIDDALKDPLYVVLRNARHALAHRRLPQHLTVGPGPQKRLELQVDATTCVSVRKLVTDARDLATTQIVGLLRLLPSL
jgi:hypothetical protein